MTINTDILFLDFDVTLKMRKLIIDNGGSVRKLNDTTIVAISHIKCEQFVSNNCVHNLYRLADETVIEAIYTKDDSGFIDVMNIT